MDLGLRDKVAIVTGAARGLGKAIALALVQEGTKVAALDIEGDALQHTLCALHQDGCAIGLQVDVADDASVAVAVRQVISVYGRIDVLVNNAGISSFTPIPHITTAEWDRVLAVNLRSMLLLSQAVFPLMQVQRSGVIINISSLAGKIGGLAIGAAYAASKAGILGLTFSLARAGAPHNVRVNALAPAFIESPMQPAENVAQYLPLIPLGRMGTPEDVAAAVLFLASDRATYITGEVLDLNGGASMD